MATAYLLMEHDHTLSTVFFDRTPTLSEFLSWLKIPNSHYLGGFVRPMSNVGQVELAGLGVLWNVSGPPGGRRADAHIWYSRKFWGNGLPEKLTGQMIDWSFTTGQIDVLYFVTPAWNRLTQRLTRRLGFTLIGPLPKYGVCHGVAGDAVIGYLEKATWEQSRRQHDVR